MPKTVDQLDPADPLSGDENIPVEQAGVLKRLPASRLTGAMNAADDLAAHLADHNNPHQTTKAQVGLSALTNDAQVKRSEMGANSGVATLDSTGRLVQPLRVPLVTREICIGNRSLGRNGTGTWDDPFNAGNASEFTALIAGLDPAFYWIIRLRDGEYTTAGLLTIPPNSDLIGAGRDATIIKLSENLAMGPGEENFVVLVADNAVGKHLVEGLTVDTSFGLRTLGDPAGLGGISLYGSIRVREVHVKGVFGHAGEQYGILVSLAPDGEVYIEHCLVDNFYGDYINGIGTGGAYLTQNSKGCVIRHCHVEGAWVNDPNLHGAGFGMDGGVIEHCTANHCQTGFYSEQSKNLVIAHCSFTDIWQNGIALFPAAVSPEQIARDITIIGNYIEIRDDNTAARVGIAISNDPVNTNHRWYNVKTIGNTVKLLPQGDPPPTDAMYAYKDGGDTPILGLGNQVIGNSFDIRLRNMVQPDTVVYGNRGLNGEIIGGEKSVYLNGYGLGLPDDFIKVIPSLPGSLRGSLRVKADTTNDDGYAIFNFPFTDYTLVDGDKLVFDIYCDPSNPAFNPSQHLTAVAEDDTTINLLGVDQNNVQMASPAHDQGDLSKYAKGKWYERIQDLGEFTGAVVNRFDVALQYGVGTHAVYLQNVRIVGTGGVIRREIQSETHSAPGGSVDPINFLHSTNYEIDSPYGNPTLAGLVVGLPTTDPHVVGSPWLNSGVVTVSAG